MSQFWVLLLVALQIIALTTCFIVFGCGGGYVVSNSGQTQAKHVPHATDGLLHIRPLSSSPAGQLVADPGRLRAKLGRIPTK